MSQPPAKLFACLADQQRLAVLGMLARSEGMSASALATRLPISRQAVAKHLAQLAEVNLVRSARAGREVRYRVDPTPLRRAADWLESAAVDWDRQLQLLKREAESESSG